MLIMVPQSIKTDKKHTVIVCIVIKNITSIVKEAYSHIYIMVQK